MKLIKHPQVKFTLTQVSSDQYIKIRCERLNQFAKPFRFKIFHLMFNFFTGASDSKISSISVDSFQSPTPLPTIAASSSIGPSCKTSSQVVSKIFTLSSPVDLVPETIQTAIEKDHATTSFRKFEFSSPNLSVAGSLNKNEVF